MNLHVNEDEVKNAINQLNIEKTNQDYYSHINIYWSSVKYMSIEEANTEYDKYFKNSPHVYLLSSSLGLISSYLKNMDEDAVNVVKSYTTYNYMASTALAYKLYLFYIKTGTFGEDYHTKGIEAKINEIKKVATPYFNINMPLPLDLRIARAAMGVGKYNSVNSENFKLIPQALGITVTPEELTKAYQTYFSEKKKEEFFYGTNAPAPVHGDTRQQAYKVVEQYFKHAPLVKISQVEEKKLEMLLLDLSKKIYAIKAFRESTAWGLKSSKNYIEYLQWELLYLGANIK